MGISAPSLRKLVSALNILLLAALVLAGLLLARDGISLALKGGSRVPVPESGGKEAAERKARKPFEAYAPIVADNVFGMPPGTLTALSTGKARAGGAPEARMEITLLGTVAWADGFGYAIVTEGSGGGQEVYRSGQYLKSGGTLSKVYRDKIIIKEGGRETEVPLVEVAPIKEVPPPASSQRPGQQNNRGGGGLQDFAKRTADNAFLVDRSAIDAALQDPRQIMTDARLLPNTVEGRQEGFVIKEIRPGGVYAKLGLENGDVLLRVNEFNISDPETALQVFTALRGMERVELDILRNGSRMTLTYNIR
ncbi:MAG: type II secretion system protein GspC [Thermodesulfovibrionales bacterium]